MESIGQNIIEYLVNYEYFIDIMKQYEFEPYKPEMETKYNKVIKNDIGSFLDIINELETLQKNDTDLNNYSVIMLKQDFVLVIFHLQSLVLKWMYLVYFAKVKDVVYVSMLVG